MIQRKNLHKLRKAEIKHLLRFVSELRITIEDQSNSPSKIVSELDKTDIRHDSGAIMTQEINELAKSDLKALNDILKLPTSTYSETSKKLQKLRGLFKKYFKPALRARRPPLYVHYYQRMKQSLVSVAKEIQNKASIYGIYNLGIKMENQTVKIKALQRELRNQTYKENDSDELEDLCRQTKDLKTRVQIMEENESQMCRCISRIEKQLNENNISRVETDYEQRQIYIEESKANSEVIFD